jgi:hypothetical protein
MAGTGDPGEGPDETGHIVLERYVGPWDPDDPDANFKREVAEYTRADPLETLGNLSANLDVPVGALARYVLVRWAAEGSEALMALGPRTVGRMWDVVEEAEAAGTDGARLEAYAVLRQMLSWLRSPLEEA